MQIDIKVPDGKIGDWEVSTFEISEEDAAVYNLRESFRGSYRYVDPGTYKRLIYQSEVIMSNTPAECKEALPIIREAKEGNILINGLGLGMVLVEIFKNPKIESITIIEKSEEVINLVYPTYSYDKRLKVIHADGLSYSPDKGKRFDAVWHDIWGTISGDNISEMSILHRRYGKRTRWQGSWCKEMCLMQRRSNSSSSNYFSLIGGKI